MQAATRVWQSSVGGLWTSTANWQDGLMPGANDAADLSAATGTIDLTADVTVGEILYNPATGGNTPKVLTILSDTAAPGSRMITLTTTATRRIQVGADAELRLDVDVKPTGTLLKDGVGTLVFKRRMPATVRTDFQLEQGRVINEGDLSIFGGRMHLGTVEPDPGAAPEFVMRPGSTYATYVPTQHSDVLLGGNRLLANGTGSRAVVTHEGGLLDLTTNKTGGVFLNGYATGSHSVYNLSGGEINLRTKGVYIGFNGTGVVNQSGGILRAAFMNFSATTGDGTYNLTGGELWLGGVAQKGNGKAAFNIGGARIYPLNTGFNIYAGTSPRLTGAGGLTLFCSDSSAYTNAVSGLTGPGGFIKMGADTLNIAGGVHSFTGPVIVSNGTVNINQVMAGDNAVTIAGGNVNLGNVAVTYSSLTVTGGMFQVAANSALSLTGTEPRVRVLGNGALRLLDGAYLPSLTVLDVSESGSIDLSGGGTSSVYGLILSGVKQMPGLYTAATCNAITGSGTLMVNGGYWIGAGSDAKWSTGANWLAGMMPSGADSVADLSGAVSVGTPSATLSLDVGGLTNKFLVLDAGIAGATVTNANPAGVTNTLYMNAAGEIHVGAGETLVLEHDLCLMGTLYKRGEGTLVLAGTTFALPSLVWGTSTITLAVEAGTVVGCGAITNVLVMPGKPDRGAAGTDPTFILADTPQAEIRGTTFLSAMSWLPTSRHPGNGTFTQLGGTIEPGINWQTRSLIGFTDAAASPGGTGTYNLANGMLRVTNTLMLAHNAGRGVFNQSGGVADIDSLDPRNGEVRLTDGVLRVDRFNNASAASCTFFLGGGRLETKAFTTVTPWLASPLIFTGEGGEMCFALEAGRTLTLSGATSGSGGFVKEGDGTLALTGSGTFSGLATVNGGTLTVSGGLSGTNDLLLLAGNLNVTSSGAAKLGTLAVTNGTVTLASGVMITAER